MRAVVPAALSRLQARPAVMRETFTAAAGLLAAIALPGCVILAAAADPIISFLYAPEWAPTAAVLPWLGLLAAARILFELVYDYFVVLANSRAVFTVQVVWFVALVPALFAACRYWALTGAGASQFAVAALVVLPFYLFELGRSGVTLVALTRRLALPVGVAAVVAGLTYLVARLVHTDLVALILAGLVGLAAMSGVVYLRRGTLRQLRTLAADDESTDPAAALVVVDAAEPAEEPVLTEATLPPGTPVPALDLQGFAHDGERPRLG